MNQSQIESMFREWWSQSFPNAPIGKHALSTHVAFAQYMLGQINYEQQQREVER